MGRYALLVGVSNYGADFTALPSAVKDVRALQRVLLNPDIGGFFDTDVTALVDCDQQEIQRAVFRLFNDRKPDDLLLFYFSGHGVTDNRSDFYLASKNANKKELDITAVPATNIHTQMNKSRSQRQVVILDCCHSGAFSKGMTAKDGGTVNVLPKLGGEGRAILTASDSTKYAFEQEGFELSLYTHFLVEGLEKGAADQDGDGEISVDELYEYVKEKVKNTNDAMSPEFYPVRGGAKIILAKSPQDDPKLKYRKEVESRARVSNGNFSLFAKNLLIRKRDEWGVSVTDADAIELEVLLPYEEYKKKLKEFEQALTEAVTIEFPFSVSTATDLLDYEQHLGLREDDIKIIKERILTPRQTEHDRQFEEQQKKIAEAARLKRQQEEAEQLRLQQIAAAERQKQEQDRLCLLEQLRKQAEEEERLKRQREETERKSKPVQPEFEFEIVKVRLVKESSGFLGLGTKTKVELERKKGKAQYVRENLGNGATLDLVRIPAGKFMMGSNEYSSEQPIHEATLREFWMGKYAVTNGQWQAIMGTKPSEKYDVKFQGENQPVVGVSWDDAKEFCQKASQKTGKSIRLPSETEWEYACRAGTTTPFHFGETITPDLVNYDGNNPYGDAPKGEYRQKTVNADSFSPNAWGLYQMHGNVREWCEDVWHGNYNGIPQDGTAWTTDGEQSIRLLRGGSWLDYAIICRSADRFRWGAGDGYIYIGFRVVASVLS
jgi:formylglycine-generating enzyme required for sulfatase activity